MYSSSMSTPLKGRGTSINPAPRYERQQSEQVDDGWYREAEPDSIATEVRPEPARSIISRNDSPDIHFSQSINPYRGCEHGCVYCLSGDTQITLANGSVRALADIRVGDEIIGTEVRAQSRRPVQTRVMAHWRTVKPAWNVCLDDGTRLIASGDHRFLAAGGWKFVRPHQRDERPHLTPSDSLMGLDAHQRIAGRSGLAVVRIEALAGERELFDITTGTGDFIANGVVSHNCYARPSHAYMGLSPGLDFETKLFFKEGAAARLEAELAKPNYVPQAIMLGANTDPYQPIEKRLGVTRSILEVLAKTHHPVSIVTKGALIRRDLDILAPMARENLVQVMVSLTSLDADLKRVLEPRAASPAARLATIRALKEAGVPVGTLIAPVIPALTDHELERLLEAAAEAGAQTAGYVVLRLPLELKELFRDWLATHYPDRARHVMSRVNALRGGADNDPRFGSRMRGTGPDALLLKQRFELACRRLGFGKEGLGSLDRSLFVPPRPPGPQMGFGF